jgi:hypothetical protein
LALSFLDRSSPTPRRPALHRRADLGLCVRA